MAQLKASPNIPILPKAYSRNSTNTRTNKCNNKIGILSFCLCLVSNCKNVRYCGRNGESGRRFWKRERGIAVVPCCSSSTSSAGKVVGLVGEGEDEDGKLGVSDGQFGYLVSEFGWKVRRLVEREDEIRKVAQVQAEAFHVPVAFFNDLFFQFFKAEVLSGLVYKLRNSPPNRYACLVAEPTDVSDSLPASQRILVGVADVTVLRDAAVLSHLEGAEEYLYVSGIAVLNEYRRQKVATTLLKACDLVSLLWGFDYLALRAYEDDSAAQKLYSNAGYRVVSGDPPWMTTWIGRKRRVLMIKQSSLREWF